MATMNFEKKTHPDIIKAIQTFNDAADKIKELEKTKEAAKAIIIAAMGNNEEAKANVKGTTMTIRYKDVSSTRVNVATLRAKYPTVAAECSTTTKGPRFTISLK